MVCPCRTSNLVANQAKQHAEPTAALDVPPPDGEDVVAGENAPVQDTGSTVADENMNPEASRNYKELPLSNKPAVKYTKKAQGRDEIQLKMLELLSTDPVPGPSNLKEDYLDIHFASITNCMRKRMSVEQQDDLLLEIDRVVNDAFQQMRRSNAGGNTAGTRSEMVDVTMGIQLIGTNQMAQQIPVPNNLQSSMKCMVHSHQINHNFKAS